MKNYAEISKHIAECESALVTAYKAEIIARMQDNSLTELDCTAVANGTLELRGYDSLGDYHYGMTPHFIRIVADGEDVVFSNDGWTNDGWTNSGSGDGLDENIRIQESAQNWWRVKDCLVYIISDEYEKHLNPLKEWMEEHGVTEVDVPSAFNIHVGDKAVVRYIREYRPSHWGGHWERKFVLEDGVIVTANFMPLDAISKEDWSNKTYPMAECGIETIKDFVDYTTNHTTFMPLDKFLQLKYGYTLPSPIPDMVKVRRTQDLGYQIVQD